MEHHEQIGGVFNSLLNYLNREGNQFLQMRGVVYTCSTCSSEQHNTGAALQQLLAATALFYVQEWYCHSTIE
jgi:hypothetical protein